MVHTRVEWGKTTAGRSFTVVHTRVKRTVDGRGRRPKKQRGEECDDPDEVEVENPTIVGISA